MKYQSIEAFDKHVKEAFPHHFSSVYVIAITDDFERRRTLEKYLSHYDEGAERHWFDLKEGEKEKNRGMTSFFQEVESLSLFAKKRVIICNHFDRASAGEITTLIELFSRLPSETYLLLGASSLPPRFYDKSKKDVVLLDLSKEKPWDKKKRIITWIASYIGERGKRMAPNALEFLVERVGTDLSTLEQDINKLLCYVGEEVTISVEVIAKVLAPDLQQKSFAIASSMVWGGARSLQGTRGFDESGSFALYLGGLRYFLHLGLGIASALEGEGDLSSLPPYVKLPHKYQKEYVMHSKRLGRGYFEEGLEYVFSLEWFVRSGRTDWVLLWDLLVIHFTRLYTSYTEPAKVSHNPQGV